MQHGTLAMYHGTLAMYHGTSAVYHGTFSYGIQLINDFSESKAIKLIVKVEINEFRFYFYLNYKNRMLPLS